jgi:hypothetical protein
MLGLQIEAVSGLGGGLVDVSLSVQLDQLLNLANDIALAVPPISQKPETSEKGATQVKSLRSADPATTLQNGETSGKRPAKIKSGTHGSCKTVIDVQNQPSKLKPARLGCRLGLPTQPKATPAVVGFK